MTPPPLVLASTSPYRRTLLARLGVPFEVAAPDCDEGEVQRLALPPDETATRLARLKALSVAARRPDAVVIGSDQVAAIGADVLTKPGDRAGAERQLARLAGREHRLFTAFAVAHPGGLVERIDVTCLTMRQLDAAAIARYVALDRPYDCVGAYKLEEHGIALFSGVASSDHTAVVGLPLIALGGVLVELGFRIP